MFLSRTVRRVRASLLIALMAMSAGTVLAESSYGHTACAVKHHGCAATLLVAPCCCAHTSDGSHPARPAESRPASASALHAPALDVPLPIAVVTLAPVTPLLRTPTHGYHATDLVVLLSTLLI